MTATYHLPKKDEVVRGVPLITRSLYDKIKGENVLESQRYSPFQVESPGIIHLFDYRNTNTNLPFLILAGKIDAKTLRETVEKEFVYRGAALHEGQVHAINNGAELSDKTGSPILSDELGLKFRNLYARKRSKEVIEVLKGTNTLLAQALEEASKKYGAEAEIDFEDLQNGEMLDLWKNMGKLGAEFSSRVLTRQNKINRNLRSL